MKNKEFYNSEIVSVACGGQTFGLFHGIPGPCPEQHMDRCSICEFGRESMFHQSCSEMRMDWAESEHIEYEIDWTKVPVDTPIKVWNEGWADDQHIPRHFAKYENGRVHTWVDGRTSFTAINRLNPQWDHAELTEPHPEWMKVKEAK